MKYLLFLGLRSSRRSPSYYHASAVTHVSTGEPLSRSSWSIWWVIQQQPIR